jgi:hypothetical protein
MSNSIKVVARFRPQNRTEIELGGQPIVEFDSEDTCRLDVCIPPDDSEHLLTRWAVERSLRSLHI